MSATYLQMPLDCVSGDREVASKCSHRPILVMKTLQFLKIIVRKSGISSPPLVDGLSDGFNVIWIHTQTNPAQMIRLHSFRPRANTFLPHCSVSHESAATLRGPSLSVPLLTYRSSLPDPTRRAVSTVFGRVITLIQESFAAWPCVLHNSTPYRWLWMSSMKGVPANAP